LSANAAGEKPQQASPCKGCGAGGVMTASLRANASAGLLNNRCQEAAAALAAVQINRRKKMLTPTPSRRLLFPAPSASEDIPPLAASSRPVFVRTLSRAVSSRSSISPTPATSLSITPEPSAVMMQRGSANFPPTINRGDLELLSDDEGEVGASFDLKTASSESSCGNPLTLPSFAARIRR